MRVRRHVALVLPLLSLAVAGCQPQLPTTPPPTQATTVRAGLVPVRLDDKDNTSVDADVATAARSYVLARKDLVGLGADDDLQLIKVHQGVDGLNHVRLQQYYQGVRVFGGDIVVHASNTTFKSFSGTLTQGLVGFNTTPTVSGSVAMAAAKGDYATGAKNASATLNFSRESNELVIYNAQDKSVHLAWFCQFYTELQNDINPGLWNYFIDAKTGAIIEHYNSLDTLSQASGPGGNAKVPRTWTNQLDVEQSGSNYVMNTTRLNTTNLNHGTSGSGTTASSTSLNFTDAPIDDAHGYAEITLNVLNDWYGYNSIDNAGYKILSRVHYSTNYENAYWDGTQMTYGDGASTFYPLSGALDVVAHEIDHGFTSFHSNLTYSGESGGNNEAFSDIAGTAAEWYDHPATANFLVGEDIFKSSTGALRNMCHQSDDGASIDNASQMTPSLDPHYSSGVMNQAFCRAAKRLASGSSTGTATQDSVHKAAKAWYVANANYWTASTGFTQACQGIVDAANSLGYSASDVTAIATAWSEVGVTCGGVPPPPPTCDETLTAESGTIQTANPYANNYNHTWCIQPASGNPVTLSFNTFATESGYDFVTIKDANGVQLSKTSGTTKPANATSTKLVVNFTSDSSVTAAGFTASFSTGGTTNQPPTVTLTSPTTGSTVSGTITVAATAADSDGSVANVMFTLPGGSTNTDTSSPYSTTFDTTTVANGTYTISAKATDNMGASTSSSVTVTVNNSTGGSCINGTFSATGLPMSIPDNNTTGITSNLPVTGNGTVASLSISAHVTHTYRGDLVVTLIAPDNSTSVLSNRAGGSADNIILTNSAVTAFNGKTGAGTWKLKIVDAAAQDVGTLDSWSLNMVGSCSGGGGGGSWSASGSPNLATVDNGSACTNLTVSATGNASDVKLDIAGTHAYRSILKGTLAHNGQTIDAFPTGTFPTGSGAFTFSNRAVAGFTGSATGAWTLCIIDTDAFGDTGVLNTWSVHNP